MTELFVEKYFSEEEYWHWKYHFVFGKDFIHNNKTHEQLYDWCIMNLSNLGGWHIRNEGVVILDKQDAIIFKLKWT